MIVGSIPRKGDVVKKLSLALIVIFLSGSGFAGANAATPVVAKKFSNCTALNKVYPGGVALSAKWVNKGGKIKNTPVVNAKVYKANSTKDRDKDGIACEN